MKKIIISISIILMLTITKILIFHTDKTYATTTTLADTVMSLTETNLTEWEGTGENKTFNGVYPTNSYTLNDETYYHEYRYVGANPNNYVRFNNDMYQIIGLFDGNSHGVGVTKDGEDNITSYGDYLIKLISVDKLTAASYGIYNQSDNATYSTTYTYKNNWSGNNSDGTTLMTSPANTNVLLNGFYLYGSATNTTYGSCADWTYFLAHNNYKTKDCNTLVGYGISNSTLRDYIETTTWYLYGYTGIELTRTNEYLCERGQYEGCTSGNSGAYEETTTAKIGLMYPSDYTYASGYYAANATLTGSSYYNGNQNWLYKGYEWTITPRSDSASYVFLVSNYGYVSSDYSSGNASGVRPTFYLKSNINITGGSGTFDDPYTVGCDNCTQYYE